jgi:hypothetical protein
MKILDGGLAPGRLADWQTGRLQFCTPYSVPASSTHPFLLLARSDGKDLSKRAAVLKHWKHGRSKMAGGSREYGGRPT